MRAKMISSATNGDGEAWKAPVITKTVSSKAHHQVNSTAESAQSSDDMSTEEWLAWVKSLPDMDIEKELHGVKKVMGAHYSQGNYAAALESAVKLEDVVSSTIGTDNAVYASCLNNIALMNKMLGHTEQAMEKYTAALHLYEKTVGKTHASYASILSNIGILYRSMCEDAKGLDRLQLVDRAEEALADALKIRVSLAPGQKMENSRDAISAAMNLAMVHRLRGGADGVEKGAAGLQEVLTIARRVCGQHDSLTAMILSNLGILLKGAGKHAEAKEAYSEALDIRSKTLGDAHPDTIISMHNLAELFIVLGNTEQSAAIQANILSILEKSRNLRSSDSNAESPTPASASASASAGAAAKAAPLQAAHTQMAKETFRPGARAGAGAGASAGVESERSAPVSEKEKKKKEVEHAPIATFATRRKKTKT